MSEILEATPIVNENINYIKKEVTNIYNNYSIYPTFLLIRIGENPADMTYEKIILKKTIEARIICKQLLLDKSITQSELEDIIREANEANDIHGIMIFRPLPEHLDYDRIAELINPLKDIDCMNYHNLEKLFTNKNVVFTPCTAQAAVDMLEYYKIPLKGKHVCIVGSSMVVGRPLEMLLFERMATITMCNIYTNDLQSITKKADIVISAIGSARFFKREYFKPETTVIDIGVSIDKDKKQYGDVDFENVVGYVEAISPMRNGVGSITTMVLLKNIVKACKTLLYINDI